MRDECRLGREEHSAGSEGSFRRWHDDCIEAGDIRSESGRCRILLDISNLDAAFVVTAHLADIPGIRNEDLDISLSGNQLQISGKREHEQEQGEGQYHTYERSYGSFTRSFTLPESADLDKIRSDMKDGELTLIVPKKPGSSPQRRKIQIGTGTKS